MGRPLLQLALHVGDHFFSGVEGASKRAFLGLIKLGVYAAALLRRVLVIGPGKLRNNGDRASGHFELHHVAGLKAGLVLY
jgi:hypothetical protein